MNFGPETDGTLSMVISLPVVDGSVASKYDEYNTTFNTLKTKNLVHVQKKKDASLKIVLFLENTK